MGRPEKTEQFTPEERRAVLRRLQETIGVIKDFDDVAGSEQTEWVFRKPSLMDGLRRIDAFNSDLRLTINHIISGKRLKRNSAKPELTGRGV